MKEAKIFLIILLLAASAYQGGTLEEGTFLEGALLQGAFQEGQKLFLENKPQEAQPLLEEALNENPENEHIYLYLGIVYEQLDQAERSIQILKRGLSITDRYRDLIYYNLGNNLFKLGEYTLAEQMYGNALDENRLLEDAYLNRANARLELENFSGARADYVQYLRLVPNASQREQIQKLINLLSGLMEEAERLKQQELRNQKALLNEVLNSMKNASEDTRNLSAGSEQIEEEYEEIDIPE